MRYANYSYHGKNINNLGDQIQILTIDYIYKKMGIDKSDVIYIDKDALGSYDGEQVILPVSMPLIDYKEHGFAEMFSPKICPVFLGLTMAKDTLLQEEVSYLKRFEPIGCRDERTLDTMRRYDIEAYLGGCCTVTLPTRKPSLRQKRVFMIDAPEGIEQYLPEKLRVDLVRDTHLFYGPMQNPKQCAAERYAQYQNEAALVITSLLHCAVPCLAMGIPVILTRTNVSYRFSWLESLLPIYTPEQFPVIDWAPQPGIPEEHKQCIFTLIEKRIKGEECGELIRYAHAFYMKRNRKPYIVDAFLPIENFLKQNWTDKEKAYRYSVWGLTQMAEMTVNYIKAHYPNAILCHVYDAKYCWKLGGRTAILPENIKRYPDEIVFVTTVSACDVAKDLFAQLNRDEKSYCLLKVLK